MKTIYTVKKNMYMYKLIVKNNSRMERRKIIYDPKNHDR